MTTELAQEEIFAVDFAALAREVAMDIMPLGDILKLHQMSDAEWQRISEHPKFVDMLSSMLLEWNATKSVKDRVKAKAATGLESQIEVYIRDIGDTTIPLAQRVEAGKFLARLGELDGNPNILGSGGGGFQIVMNIGASTQRHEVTAHPVIEATAIPEP